MQNWFCITFGSINILFCSVQNTSESTLVRFLSILYTLQIMQWKNFRFKNRISISNSFSGNLSEKVRSTTKRIWSRVSWNGSAHCSIALRASTFFSSFLMQFIAFTIRGFPRFLLLIPRLPIVLWATLNRESPKALIMHRLHLIDPPITQMCGYIL